MDYCGTRIRPSACKIYLAPLTAIKIAGHGVDTDGPHQERMKTLRAKSYYISKTLNYVQESQNDNLDFRGPEKKQERFSSNTSEDLTGEVNFSKHIDRTSTGLGQIEKYKINIS